MSSTVNYDDLYEEFVRLTSSPKNPSSQLSPEAIIIKTEKVTPVNSPLRALTPPSPFAPVCIPTPRTATNPKRQLFPSSYSSPDETSTLPYNNSSMCDNREAPVGGSSIVVSTGQQFVSGKHLMDENNLGPTNGTGPQPFTTGTLLVSSSHQIQNAPSGNNSQFHGHAMIMESHHAQQLHHHHHSQIQSLTHHPANFSLHQQQQLLESQHPPHHHHNPHAQQMNLGPPQHGASHQLSHPFHHPHLHPHGPPPVMPFGMNLSTSNSGNGAAFGNPPLNLFQHPHQISNHQPAHSLSTLQQHACFMQHPACMRFQQHQVGNPRSSNGLGWVGGPPSSSASAPASSNGSSGGVAGGGSNQGNGAISTVQTRSSVKAMTLSPVIPDPNALPGGLDVLWREVPVECQRIMIPQDVPDSARFRGYFTVCELLALKRVLVSRYSCGEAPAAPLLPIVPATKAVVKEELQGGGGRRPRKAPRIDSGNASGTGSQKSRQSKSKSNGAATTMPVPEVAGELHIAEFENNHSSPNGEVMISLDNCIKQEIHTGIPEAITGIGVGGAVKEALEALSADQLQNAVGAGEKQHKETIENGDGEVNDGEVATCLGGPENIILEPAEALQEADVVPEVAGSHHIVEVESSILSPLTVGSFADRQQCSSSSVTAESEIVIPAASINAADQDCRDVEEQSQAPIMPFQVANSSAVSQLPPTSNYFQMNPGAIVPTSSNCCVPVENRLTGPAPPYRTSTLVLRMLHIGGYRIRSFSSVNPNRLRVLFNTQRLTYECQLTSMTPSSPTLSQSSQPLRKVLTVDIGFDQVTMLRFGKDSICMRINGPPLLTISYTPTQEESSIQELTRDDQHFLDQIELGQLKLSPCHQLYILNERLVQQLESQMREHPKFKHLLQQCGDQS